MKKIVSLILAFGFSLSAAYAQHIQLSGRNRCQLRTKKPKPPKSSQQSGDRGGSSEYQKWERKIKRKPHKKLKLIESHIIGKFVTRENFREDPRAIYGILKFIGSKPGFGLKQFKVAYKDPALPKLSKNRLAIQGLDDTVARLTSSSQDVQTITQIYHPNQAKEGRIDDDAVVIDIVIDRGRNNIYDYLALLLHGHQEVVLTARQREILKDYLQAGGFLFVSACCGMRPFERGFKKEMELMFPQKKFKPLPASHPLYKSYYTIDKFVYTGKEKVPGGKPYLEGINIGCRTAVIFSPHDFCCAWDGHIHGDQEPYASVRELSMKTALRLGANLISYALGYRDLSKPLQPRKEYKKKKKSRKRGDFVFAQIKHQGDWDTNPRGIDNLLQFLSKKTNVEVYPKRRIVDINKTDIFQYPFLYISGHYGFSFNKEALEKLRMYFKKGGFLFADACCGEKKFDRSFRAFIKKMFPKKALSTIPLSHSIFSIYYDIRKVPYTKLAKRSKSFPQLTGLPQHLRRNQKTEKEEDIVPLWKQNSATVDKPLHLEGVFIEDRPVVIYSRYGIGCSWEQMPCLMCKGVDPLSEAGFKIAANVIIYAFSGE